MTNEDSMTPADTLAAHHAAFLDFVRKRVGSDADAEDILQQAFVKGLDRIDTVEEDEKVTAWFYRLLRNAIIDWYRNRPSRSRVGALDDGVIPATEDLPPSLAEEVCACVRGLLPHLDADHAAILQSVDIEGRRIVDLATTLGVSAGALRARLFRARESLRRKTILVCRTCAEHHCVDCHCGDRKKNGSSTP